MKTFPLLCALGLLWQSAPAAATVVVAQPPQPLPPPPPPADDSARLPGDDALGDVWEMEEVAQWRGVWIRRGRSERFDGYWVHPTGERVRAMLEIHVKGDDLVVQREHPGGQSCTYQGRIGGDRVAVTGTYTCSWERTPMPWRAQIIRMREVSPAILREDFGRR